MDQPAYTPTCCGQLAKWVEPMRNMAYFYCEKCKKEVDDKPKGSRYDDDDENERLKSLLDDINSSIQYLTPPKFTAGSGVASGSGGSGRIIPIGYIPIGKPASPPQFCTGDTVYNKQTGGQGTIINQAGVNSYNEYLYDVLWTLGSLAELGVVESSLMAFGLKTNSPTSGAAIRQLGRASTAKFTVGDTVYSKLSGRRGEVCSSVIRNVSGDYVYYIAWEDNGLTTYRDAFEQDLDASPMAGLGAWLPGALVPPNRTAGHAINPDPNTPKYTPHQRVGSRIDGRYGIVICCSGKNTYNENVYDVQWDLDHGMVAQAVPESSLLGF